MQTQMQVQIHMQAQMQVQVLAGWVFGTSCPPDQLGDQVTSCPPDQLGDLLPALLSTSTLN